MTEQETCPACEAQIRYLITTDSYMCVGCGKEYAWPLHPPSEPPEEINREEDAT